MEQTLLICKILTTFHNSQNMRNFSIALLLTFLCSNLFAQIQTPAPSPSATVSQTIGLSKVTIEYSRPMAKGRKIFGDLVPFDKVWRTGANKITSIAFEKDMLINGQKIAAGSYGWYTIPGKTEWIVVLNSDDKQWGAYGYDQKKDVLRLPVKAEKHAMTEQLTISIESISPTVANVVLAWEGSAFQFKLEHNADAQIMAEIKEKTAMADAKTDTYFDAADYYYEHNIDLDKALMWAEKVVEADKQYWTYQLRARILAKMGKCDKAVADAKISLEMAKKEGDDAYVKKNEQILKQCGGK